MYTDVLNKLKSKIDYCSGVPDYPHMRPACKDHDEDYKNQIGKWKADWKFAKRGWENATGYTKKYKRVWARSIAVGYYIGVTLFGWWAYYKSGKKLHA